MLLPCNSVAIPLQVRFKFAFNPFPVFPFLAVLWGIESESVKKKREKRKQLYTLHQMMCNSKIHRMLCGCRVHFNSTPTLHTLHLWDIFLDSLKWCIECIVDVELCETLHRFNWLFLRTLGACRCRV